MAPGTALADGAVLGPLSSTHELGVSAEEDFSDTQVQHLSWKLIHNLNLPSLSAPAKEGLLIAFLLLPYTTNTLSQPSIVSL